MRDVRDKAVKPPKRTRIEIRRQRRKTMATLLATTEHSPVIARKKWTCIRCGNGAARTNLRAFLPTPCTRTIPISARPQQVNHANIQVGGTTIHSTHRISWYRGIYWCRRCGSFAITTPRNLRRACEGPTTSGRKTLGRLQRGLTPRSDVRWPGPDEHPVEPELRQLWRHPAQQE